MNDHDLLLAIQNRLDGVEWSSDTLEEIAELMVASGYRIRDPQLEGRRVRLVRCTDQHTRLPVGILGTVAFVDDVGTVHVAWDNGSLLGLCTDAGDQYELIRENRE